MKRPGIAVWLKELVAHEAKHQQYLLPTHIDRAKVELKKLLALEKAVRQGVQPECCWGYDPKTKRCRCAQHRALERIAEASVAQLLNPAKPTRRKL